MVADGWGLAGGVGLAIFMMLRFWSQFRDVRLSSDGPVQIGRGCSEWFLFLQLVCSLMARFSRVVEGCMTPVPGVLGVRGMWVGAGALTATLRRGKEAGKGKGKGVRSLNHYNPL